MDNLIEKLKKICDDMEVITELTKKYNDYTTISLMMVYKNIEDGIISNLHAASHEQLKTLMREYTFKYYDVNAVQKLIDSAIIKNSRRDKMKQISIK